MQLFFSSPADSSRPQLDLGFCAVLSMWRDNGWEEEREEDGGEAERRRKYRNLRLNKRWCVKRPSSYQYA